MDLLSLLPSSKESIVAPKKAEDEEEDRKRSSPRSFQNWLQAFCIYSAILVEQRPSLAVGLFQHVDIILEAYRNFSGMSWFTYNEPFCQKLAVFPHMSLGVKDFGLWLNVMLPARQSAGNGQTASQGSLLKGVCFAFDES